MEKETTNTLHEHKTNLDKALTTVMPSDWEGHGRLAIRQSDDVPASIEEKAIEKMNKVADKKGVEPERVANKIISHIADKTQE